ncbi:protein of unknown function [Petrocella atlantisensis]|uniref:Uncharacterized protein n=1 Tax=Petrocella atlantisensis TaxID=2173034 RepID=A0A3P7PJT2_9FIRM|nr:protein of unknown function [Petrocella atlantisensis]
MLAKIVLLATLKNHLGPMNLSLLNNTDAEPNEERNSTDQSLFYRDVERPSFLHGCKKGRMIEQCYLLTK